jgi:hypothetical protein
MRDQRSRSSDPRVVRANGGCVGRVLEDPVVGRHQRRSEVTGRRDEEAVERICQGAPRDQTRIERDFRGYRCDPEVHLVEGPVDPRLHRQCEAQPAERVQRGNFEDGDGGQQKESYDYWRSSAT